MKNGPSEKFPYMEKWNSCFQGWSWTSEKWTVKSDSAPPQPNMNGSTCKGECQTSPFKEVNRRLSEAEEITYPLTNGVLESCSCRWATSVSVQLEKLSRVFITVNKRQNAMKLKGSQKAKKFNQLLKSFSLAFSLFLCLCVSVCVCVCVPAICDRKTLKCNVCTATWLSVFIDELAFVLFSIIFFFNSYSWY